MSSYPIVPRSAHSVGSAHLAVLWYRFSAADEWTIFGTLDARRDDTNDQKAMVAECVQDFLHIECVWQIVTLDTPSGAMTIAEATRHIEAMETVRQRWATLAEHTDGSLFDYYRSQASAVWSDMTSFARDHYLDLRDILGVQVASPLSGVAEWGFK